MVEPSEGAHEEGARNDAAGDAPGKVAGAKEPHLAEPRNEQARRKVDKEEDEGGEHGPAVVFEVEQEDQQRKAEEKLEALLLEGLSSGAPIEITPEYWERKRRQFIKRHQKKSRG